MKRAASKGGQPVLSTGAPTLIFLILAIAGGFLRPALAQEKTPSPPPMPIELGPQDPTSDPTAGLSRKDARIRDLQFYSNASHLYLDLRLEGAFIGEIWDRVESGLEVTFTYTLELYKKKKGWFDRRLVHTRLRTRVVRDNMAGRYILTRLNNEDEEIARATTEDPAKVREWMTRLEKISLLPIAEVPPDKPDKEGRTVPRMVLRARAHIRDEFVMLFIPWDFETDWERVVVDLDQVPTRTDTNRARPADEEEAVAPPQMH